MARARSANVLLTRRADAELLVEALATWAATRDAAVANLVDALTASAVLDWAAPQSTEPDAFQLSWLRVASHPVGRGWAIANLLLRLPGAGPFDRAAALATRLRALLEAGADPRVGHALARWIAGAESLFGFTEPLRLAEQIVIDSRDDRVRALFADVATADLDEEFRAVVARVLAKPPLGRAATRRELDRLSIAAAPRSTASADVGALVAQVFARPADDEPRMVLADALQAAGDPRGELISLQLAAPSEAGYKRIDQLVKAAGKDWLGELAAITYRAQFQRGFVARLELAKSYASGLHEFEQLCTHPTLATIEELVPGEAHGTSYAALATSPAMKSLRRIEVYDTDTIVALEQTPHAITHVACPRLKRGSGNYIKGLVGRVLPACGKARSISSVGIQAEGFEALVASKLLDKLTSITIGDDELGAVLALWKKLPRATALVAKRFTALEACLGVRVAWLGELTIAREDGELVGRVWGEWSIGAVVEHFDALPKLDRLIVQAADATEAKRLATAGTNRKIEIVVEPAPIRSGYITLGR